jgi:hypothetical protein
MAKRLGSGWVSLLSPLELNWLQYQIKQETEIDCDSSFLFWFGCSTCVLVVGTLGEHRILILVCIDGHGIELQTSSRLILIPSSSQAWPPRPRQLQCPPPVPAASRALSVSVRAEGTKGTLAGRFPQDSGVSRSEFGKGPRAPQSP